MIPALETYQYTPLQSGAPTFRLLKLLKYQGPEVECELLPQSLLNDEHVPYEALSYVWGSNELVECIILNRKRLWVTDNLHSALQYLRLHDRDRYLWIDAICINQTDKEEQGWQVRQMGKIFGSAEAVLFWLGKATVEILSLMDTLNQYHGASLDSLLRRLTHDDNGRNDCRTGLRQLLSRPWFTRVWILQEVANARKATVCCGTQSVPAETFARAPSMIGEEPEPHCQAILDIMPGPSRSGSWWDQKRDLSTLLRRFQASKATDERDKIYALLGMSSDSSDTESIEIDYRKPTHEVVLQAVEHLRHTTPLYVHEILNIMYHFETLETTYFVLPFGQWQATEILFPHLQPGNMLSMPLMPEEPNFMSQGIQVVNDPALFLFEKRLGGNIKEDETCYSQVVRLVLGGRANQPWWDEKVDDGLRVISWGSPEHRVQIVMILDRRKAILQAVQHGCAHIVKHLLRLGLRDEDRDQLVEEVLQKAVVKGDTLTVRTILQAMTHMHVQGEQYDDVLIKAVQEGKDQIVKLLVDAGADLDEQCEYYNHELQQASFNGHEQIIKLLFNKGADVNSRGMNFYGTAIQAASAKGHEAVVKMLLNAGADPNARDGIYYGAALYEASFRGYEQIIKLLLNAGADVNAQGGKYSTALQVASIKGYEAVVKMLLNEGVNINAQGGKYGTALQAASYRGHEAVVKMLLNAGANVNAQGGKYSTALQAASYRGHKLVVKMLLNAGANVNAQGGRYGTALQAASYLGNEATIKLLLDAGANSYVVFRIPTRNSSAE